MDDRKATYPLTPLNPKPHSFHIIEEEDLMHMIVCIINTQFTNKAGNIQLYLKSIDLGYSFFFNPTVL